MKHTLLVAFAAALAAPLAAQTCKFPQPIPDALTSRGVLDASTPGQAVPYSLFRVATSETVLPADTSKGLVPSARVAYAVWVDKDANGNNLSWRKSTNGGLTWGNATVLYSIPSTGTGRVDSLEILAEGHRVFVVVAMNDAGTGDNGYLFGSDDQGQTWDGPVLFQTGINDAPPNTQADIDEMEAVISSGVVHIVFESDYVGHTSTEDGYYTSWTIVNGKLTPVVASTRFNSAYGPRTFDIDSCEVAARGATVAITWRDDRRGHNNVYGKVSQKSGTDWATVKEWDFTQFATSIRLRDPKCAVGDSQNIHFVWDSNDNAAGDQVYVQSSQDGGQTFAKAVLSPQNDADGPCIDAEGSRVVVTWKDDRNNPQNADVNAGNDLWFRRSDDGGKTWLAEVRANADTPPNCDRATGPTWGFDPTPWAIEVRGDLVVIVAEEDWYNNTSRFGEDTRLHVSRDGGATWTGYWLTNDGSAFNPPTSPGGNPGGFDVDDPVVSVSANGDIVAAWVNDAPNRTAGSNVVQLGGVRVPELIDMTKTSKGLELRLATRDLTGKAALVLLSTSGISPALMLDPKTGVGVDLKVDAATTAFLTVPLFLRPIASDGRAVFTGIPDLGKIVPSIPVYAAAVVFDTTTFLHASDPFRF